MKLVWLAAAHRRSWARGARAADLAAVLATGRRVESDEVALERGPPRHGRDAEERAERLPLGRRRRGGGRRRDQGIERRRPTSAEENKAVSERMRAYLGDLPL